MYEPPVVERTDHNSPFDRLTKKAAWVVTLIAVVLYFVFEYVGGAAEARAASICAGMVITCVWMRWDLRKQTWFWVTVAVLSLLQVPLVTMVPWTNKNYPGVVLLPGALLDLGVIYGGIKLVEKLLRGSRRD